MTVEFSVTAPSRFDEFWQQDGEWVEAPNQRRGGESGVQRLRSPGGQLMYVKRQVGHLYRSWLHPLGRPTVLRERDAIVALQGLEVNVPRLVFCGTTRDAQSQWRALLVTEALDGYLEIDQWYLDGQRERVGEAAHDHVLAKLAGNLARMHKARWQHGCLYMKHIFVRVRGEGATADVDVALLDLEKCRQRLSASKASAHDLKQLRRHSSWSDAEWSKLLYFYQTAFGSAIKGL